MANEKQSERVVVEIYGTSYPLLTDNPAELKRLAAGVDRMMKDMSRQVRTFDDRKVAVLTALQLAGEYAQLKRDYDELAELLDEK